MFNSAAVNEILGDVGGMLESAFAAMEWAEDEIEAARRRYPEASDRIYHSFKLLVTTHELMSTEMVYRSHAREILARVAAGQDTRPGTAAEVCCLSHDASLLAPLTTTAAGLYARMWQLAGFPGNHWDESGEHYEGLYGRQIGDLETEARSKTSVADRKLGDIDCQGMHHGAEVSCQYATRELAAVAV